MLLCMFNDNDNWQWFSSFCGSYVTPYMSTLPLCMSAAMKMITIMIITVLKMWMYNEAINYHELAKLICKMMFGFFVKLETLQGTYWFILALLVG